MSCSTTRNEDGGVTVMIDRPEISLNLVFSKGGHILKQSWNVKPYEEPKKVHNEYVCNHRGEVMKTEPCCGGHQRRPTEVVCKSDEMADRVSYDSCNSEYCKFYEV